MHLFSLTVNFWFWEIRVAICFHIFKNGTGIYFLLARNLCFWEACGIGIFLELAYLLIKCPIFYWDKFFCSLSTCQLKIASSFVIIVSIEFSSYVYLLFFIRIIQFKLVATSFYISNFCSWEFHVVKMPLGVALKSLQTVLRWCSISFFKSRLYIYTLSNPCFTF